MNCFLSENNILKTFPSDFQANHSTETVLVKLLRDLRLNADANKVSVWILLDLNSAIDTIDHDTLIDRVENWVGLSGTVFKWFR